MGIEKKQLPKDLGIGHYEFICLIASMMAVSALTIDTILPAFGVMSLDFGLSGEQSNHVQWVIYSYMLGFAIMQVFYGALADALGRKPIVLTGLAIFLLGSLGAALAPSFGFLLAMRALQGIGTAALRVLSMTIVRDNFIGSQMSRISSTIFSIFIIVPIIAPSIGQMLLFFTSWHSIFWMLVIVGAVVAFWFHRRMPETLEPEHKRALSFVSLIEAIKLCMCNRMYLVYATASGLSFAILISYLGSAEQIYQREIYHLGEKFALVFAAVAVFIGLASVVNARCVTRIGMYRMSYFATVGFFVLSLVLLLLSMAYKGRPPLFTFSFLLGLCLFCFNIMSANFNAIAMTSVAAIAGTSSSILGFYSTIVGTVIGGIIGQAFNNTVLPFVIGLSVLGGLILALITWGNVIQRKLAG